VKEALRWLKYVYHTKLGRIILYFPKRLYDTYRTRLIPKEKYIKKKFYDTFAYHLPIDNPKTLNEKIQWLKLHKRDPMYALCSDKYGVRSYVKEKVGDNYLIPLLYKTKDPYKIKPDNLPDTPYIIKTNHGSSGGIIVRDEAEINWRKVQLELSRLLKRNYYYQSGSTRT
jgi:hypothetical protein